MPQIMIKQAIAWHVQRVVNSLQLLLFAKYAQVATSKIPSQQMQKNVEHALLVDLLLMIVMMNHTMIPSKIV